MSVEKPLRDAYDAFDDSLSLVLDHLLTAWRLARAPAIADAIDVASTACRVGQPPLGGAMAAHKDEWDRVARLQNPADLDRLIESLILREATLSKDRVLLLQSWPPNPRFSSLLVAHLQPRMFKTTKEGRQFWNAIEDLHALMQDTRIPEQLQPPGTKSARFRAKRATWPGGTAELDDAEREVVAKIVDRFRARATQVSVADRRGGELLWKIYEAPDDDSARIVYADWLIERRDPRGEFITLQFERHAGKISRANAARERALFAQYWETWLGGVRGFFRKDTCTFERGFLATAKLNSVAPLHRPEWNTCRKMDLSHAGASPDGVLYLFSESYQLRGLREIVGLASTAIERFATRKNEGGRLVPDTPPSSRTRRDRGGNFTAVRASIERLEVSGPQLTHDTMLMLDLPRLRELVWTATGTPITLFGALVESTLLPSLECVHYTDDSSMSRVTLERDESGQLKRVRLLNPNDENRPSLETMCTSLGLGLIET